MADKLNRNDKMAEKTLNNPCLVRQAPDIMRLEEQEKQSLHLNQAQGMVPAPRKKTSSFQITSVTVAPGSRLSNDGGDDSADDLDESHTEDISSELLDISKTTDVDNDYSSEDAFSSSVDPVPTPNIHPVQHQIPNNGQGDASHLQVPVSSVSNSDDSHHDRSIPWHTRFRVVKIQSSEPFKRGRWLCMDFTDPPPSQNESGEKESGSGNSSTASSMQYGESFIEFPIGQEVFYQPSDSSQQQSTTVPLQQQPHHPTSMEQNVQTSLLSSQPQSVIVQGVSEYQNQTLVGNNLGSAPVVVPQHHTQSLVQQTNVQSGIIPSQHMAVHHGGSIPVPLSAQSSSVPPSEFYNVPQGGNPMAPPLSQTDFQGVQIPPQLVPPPTDYVGVPQHGSTMPGAGLHQAEYISVHPSAGGLPTGMLPGDYVTPAQSQLPPAEYNVPPSMPLQTEYVNIHQSPADYINVHQQGASIPSVMPPTDYIQAGGMPPLPQASMPPPPSLQGVHQQGASIPPPQGDYSIHQGAPQLSSEYHTHPTGAPGLVQPSGNLAPGLPQGTSQGIASQVQPSSSSNVPPNMVTPNMPPSQQQLIPSSMPQQVGEYEYVSIPVGQNSSTTGTLPPNVTSVAPSNQQLPASEQGYNIPNSRPSTITISSTSTESSHDAVGSTTVTLTPPMLDNLSVSGKEGEDPESASGSSTVAIDNKIEQAMDLVKSHLMFAVREEVEVLKEKIMELTEKISQLEKENTILRAAASQETLAKLPQPPTKSQPSKPSS